MPRIIYKFSQDEVQKRFPYAFIAETMASSRWGTMKRRRLYKTTFTVSEQARVRKIYAQAYRWFLVSGIPAEGIMMTADDVALWAKLAEFCSNL